MNKHARWKPLVIVIAALPPPSLTYLFWEVPLYVETLYPHSTTLDILWSSKDMGGGFTNQSLICLVGGTLTCLWKEAARQWGPQRPERSQHVWAEHHVNISCLLGEQEWPSFTEITLCVCGVCVCCDCTLRRKYKSLLRQLPKCTC